MIRLYLTMRSYAILFLMLASSLAMAQEQVVTGKLSSGDDNSPIPGVNVVEKGTSNGTVTDADGNYRVSVGKNATLVFSFVGYTSQEVVVGTQSTINIPLSADVTSLSEVVVVGYGSQDKKEITGSVVSLNSEAFNKGNVNDPTQLLQGKVAGLSIYNRGGNPNSSSTIRLRGISTVGANSQPLVVIDGVLGASLDNVDPNDIETINVLKDGSAAAIYGSRGSSGVILVTTKKGSKKSGGSSLTYNGYVAAAEVLNNQPVMTASEYVAAGGNNLGSVTDWQKEVTRTAVSNVHNIALSGGNQSTTFRVATNFRNINGILKKSGFEQVNARANVTHTTFNDKLKIDLNFSLTSRESNFSFDEALRYAVLFNPTAPIRFPESEGGGFYQAILFDNFNPVAILEQNKNEGRRKNINYGAKIDYSLTKDITLTANYGQQFENNFNGSYFARNSFFVGLNRKGLARRFSSESNFQLFEGYGTYSKQVNKINLDVTAGYSFQQDSYEDLFVEAGFYQNDARGYDQIENSGDLISGIAQVNTNRSPDNRIVAFFGRANFTYDNAIFFNASIRREGSTKLGPNNRYGIFPALGLGVDLNKYLDIPNVDLLKFRAGYGVTGSLPSDAGISQDFYQQVTTGGGAVLFRRNANPDLKWEQKEEINVAVDFGVGGKLTGSLDFYTRTIKDFILERDVDVAVFQSGRRFENAGSLKTNGVELSLNYNSINIGQLSWTPGIVLSSYKTTLESFIIDKQVRGNFGSPGQNGTPLGLVEVGTELGRIWGPVFDGVNTNGSPRFQDVNGDGNIVSNPSSALLPNADFKTLGNGIPSMELGWTNQLSYKNWDLNFFFRGAFGHSLVNSFRGFYEPIDPGAINSYNRIKTDKAVDGLTSAQFSSLYVEKADFLKLDNITLGYNFKTANTNLLRNFRVYATVQNAFVITKYTGIDPEPSLTDPESGDPLLPGMDRRNTYFTARTFTFGLSFGL